MKNVLVILYFLFWLVIWFQLFILIFFFFSMLVADYRDRFLRFSQWLIWLFLYVYLLPLHKYGFSKWQNWIYFYWDGKFTSTVIMQWFCEPTPWLVFMFFCTFLCFFYEWSLKHRYDRFLIFLLCIIAYVILTL